MKHYILYVTDYEHEGDLRAAEERVREICPEAKNLKSYAQIDREAEHEYEREYGELDEHIYEGFVEFDADAVYEDVFDYSI